MRILHYSDPHLSTSPLQMGLGNRLSKRGLGALNLVLRRGKAFAGAAEKLAALARFQKEQQVDLVVCSGDFTALGLEREYIAAAECLAPLMDAPMGYVHVPGNHDLYLQDAVHRQLFARYFAATPGGPGEFQLDEPWPMVRLLGDDLAVIAVNSSRPNPLLWRSSGRVPDGQLSSLAALLVDERIAGRLVFIVTHYAPLLADATPDSRQHGLSNWREFLAACSVSAHSVVLCGHVHRCYQVCDPETGLSIFCAGSATMEGREGIWLFDVKAESGMARPGIWRDGEYVLNRNVPGVELKINRYGRG